MELKEKKELWMQEQRTLLLPIKFYEPKISSNTHNAKILPCWLYSGRRGAFYCASLYFFKTSTDKQGISHNSYNYFILALLFIMLLNMSLLSATPSGLTGRFFISCT
jgi:hypothetical protein